jgi:hypothetical protein
MAGVFRVVTESADASPIFIGVIMTTEERSQLYQELLALSHLMSACRSYGLSWEETKEYIEDIPAMQYDLQCKTIRDILLTKEPDTLVKIPRDLVEYLEKLV